MKVKFISKEQLLEMMENKEKFKLVEVLPKESYEEGHLPQAINLSLNEIENLASKAFPDKEELIVVYCASFTCTASTVAARKLHKFGYKNVFDYKGGKKDWQKAGLPLVK